MESPFATWQSSGGQVDTTLTVTATGGGLFIGVVTFNVDPNIPDLFVVVDDQAAWWGNIDNLTGLVAEYQNYEVAGFNNYVASWVVPLGDILVAQIYDFGVVEGSIEWQAS